jgi:hypothetical protein
MADENNKDQRKKTVKELADEQEKLRILAQSDQVKGEQLTITPAGNIGSEKELLQSALGDIDDPKKKFDLYYKGISRLLRAIYQKVNQTKLQGTSSMKKRIPSSPAASASKRTVPKGATAV